MVKLVNRARMTTVSIGTGTLTLGVAVDGFQSFVAAGVANGDVVRYVIEEGSAWEIGTGTYASSGTALTRNVSESSAGGSPISLNGTAIVSLVLTAADLAGKADAGDPRFADAREWTASTVTQAEAEAGTATTRRAWSALRIRQAILSWWNSTADKTKLDGIAAGAQVNVATNLGIGGTGNTRTITSSTGSNVTVPVATASNAGLMATGDKTKLDGIAAGAQVNVATNLGYTTAASAGSVTSSTGANAALPAATPSVAGLLTSADKTKLDSIAAGAQVNVATNLGITGTGNARAITSSTGSNVSVPMATASNAGLMATGDKSKLDGIAAGAQVNTVTSVAGRTGAVTLGVADVSGAFAASAIPAGTRMLFAQSAAPTGWTKDTTHNNKALRVVSGTAGTGGSLAFTTAFGNRTTASTAAGGTVAAHTLTFNEMPSHGHNLFHGARPTSGGGFGGSYFGSPIAAPSAHGVTENRNRGDMVTAAGNNWAHAHGFTGAAHAHGLDMQVQYVDIIIATKA